MVKVSFYWLALFIVCLCKSALADTAEYTLQPFRFAPFPLIDSQANSFFDTNTDGRRGHSSPRGGLLWEDITYSDNRVLLARPSNINSQTPATLVVFLHGNQATLQRDLVERQQIPAQISAAGVNAYLIAPQFAVDALDSSPGNFAQKNYFARFVKEAAAQIGRWQNNNFLGYQLNRAPIILVSYSGGYLAAANILGKGGLNDRIKGVILLDSLYGQEDVFARWLRLNYRKSFFFSAYTEPARASNEALQNILREQGLKFETRAPESLRKNTIHFMHLDETTVHNDLLTHAWTDQPLTDLLRKTNTVTR